MSMMVNSMPKTGSPYSRITREDPHPGVPQKSNFGYTNQMGPPEHGDLPERSEDLNGVRNQLRNVVGTF